MKNTVSMIINKNSNLRRVSIIKGSSILFVIIIILVVSIISSYSFIKYKKINNTMLLSAASASLNSDNQKNLNNLSKLMWLPKEKIAPRIFEITDPVLLSKDQSFYSGSIVGDILVIFDESKKAVIYSPTRNIIINTGTFIYKNIDSSELN